MGEFDTDAPAVGRAKSLQDLAQRLDGPAGQVARDERLIELLCSEAVVGRIEFREVGVVAAEGIRAGDEVPPRAIGVDHAKRACVTIGELIGERGAHPLELRLRVVSGPNLGSRSGIGRRWVAKVHRPARIDGTRIRLVALADLLHDSRVHPEGPK